MKQFEELKSKVAGMDDAIAKREEAIDQYKKKIVALEFS
jgi:hypothetical protein